MMAVRGFKAGLEIHQQLPGTKLFSKKEAVIEEDSPIMQLKRHLNLSVSELGASDSAAYEQAKKDRQFHYNLYHKSCGLVEADEEPPSNISDDALHTALQFCQLTKAKVIDYGIVMRKIVIDGSNTSGFQRTMLIATQGRIDSHNIDIDTITIEEDSAKNDKEYYNLSRMGIPLIEIATAPCFDSPESLKKGALEIGRTLRLLNVKRGIGTIRQDVNISIPEGARVEIKGAQDVRTLNELAEIEAQRQEMILGFGREARNRGLSSDSIMNDFKDVTLVLQKSDSQMIVKALARKERAMAMRLEGFKGMIGLEVMPGKRIGTEMSDYAKAYTSIKGLVHSDEAQSSIISQEDADSIMKVLGCDDNDAFIMIVAEEKTAMDALERAAHRLSSLMSGVPSEVRRANPDNTTTYLREMAGSARMYPETDLDYVSLSKIKVKKPKTSTSIRKEYKKMGLGDEMIKVIMDSPQRTVYDEIVNSYPGKEMLVAKALFLYPKEAKKRHNKDVPIDNNFLSLLDALCKGKIVEDSFVDAISQLDKKNPEELIQKYAPVDTDKVKDEIRKIVRELTEKNPSITRGALMGEIMKHYAGKLSGKDAMRLLSEALSERE
jgi:glutamyl-tRNA(Gln) amidotransferase subunit E